MQQVPTLNPSPTSCLHRAPVPVQVKVQEDHPLQYAGAHHLSGLRQLQHLALWANWDDRKEWYLGGYASKEDCTSLPAQLLSALTCLTRLESNVFTVSLPDLSSCVNLQHLVSCMALDGRPQSTHYQQLQPADWSGLAHLTRLTQLRMLNASCWVATPGACEALSKLTGLQVAAAAGLCQNFLPALAACQQLTELIGEWHWAFDKEVRIDAALALPQVVVLGSNNKREDACFQHFPNLRHWRSDVLVDGGQVRLGSVISPPDLHSLCQHCTGLMELVLTAADSSFDAPDLDDQPGRVAALQSLTHLRQLTCLKFTPHDSFELLALVQAACVLEGHSLRELHVSEGNSTEVSRHAWMQLGKLRQLRQLSVEGRGYTYACLAVDAAVFLGALSGCGAVLLSLPGPTWPFEEAPAALRRAGLPAPRVELHGSS